MKKILDELNRVEKKFENLDIEEHRNQKYKDDREWWVLGKLKLIFQNENLRFPDYAEKLEVDDTDFDISYDGEKIFKRIQITEVVPIEYKKRGGKNPEDIVDTWQLYEQILMNKLNMRFGLNNWLVIYFDELYSKLNDYGYWHNVILEKTKKIDFSKSTFEKILVIDSKGDAAVSLYPYLFVLRPEWCNDATMIDQCFYRKKSYYNNIEGN